MEKKKRTKTKTIRTKKKTEINETGAKRKLHDAYHVNTKARRKKDVNKRPRDKISRRRATNVDTQASAVAVADWYTRQFRVAITAAF